MTTNQWLTQARRDAVALAALLENYHPLKRQPGTRREIASESGALLQRGDWITAPNAEAACVGVRKAIKDKGGPDPVTQFHAALNSGDDGTVYRLLSEAWFGVPESTACWSITGFRECVALCEDPPCDEDNDHV